MFLRIITRDQMMLGGFDEDLLPVLVNDGLEQPVSSSSESRFSAVVLTFHTPPCSRAFKAKRTQNPAEPRTSSVVMETQKSEETMAARTRGVVMWVNRCCRRVQGCSSTETQ